MTEELDEYIGGPRDGERFRAHPEQNTRLFMVGGYYLYEPGSGKWHWIPDDPPPSEARSP